VRLKTNNLSYRREPAHTHKPISQLIIGTQSGQPYCTIRQDGNSDAETTAEPASRRIGTFLRALTAYDKEHLITYPRLLDADAGGVDWAEASRVILHIDPDREPNRARRAYNSHLKRSKWMTEFGYRYLLR
jgi:hypothetical protein